jgi:hypothetical protein
MRFWHGTRNTRDSCGAPLRARGVQLVISVTHTVFGPGDEVPFPAQSLKLENRGSPRRAPRQCYIRAGRASGHRLPRR